MKSNFQLESPDQPPTSISNLSVLHIKRDDRCSIKFFLFEFWLISLNHSHSTVLSIRKCIATVFEHIKCREILCFRHVLLTIAWLLSTTISKDFLFSELQLEHSSVECDVIPRSKIQSKWNTQHVGPPCPE